MIIDRFNTLHPLQLLSILFIVCCACVIFCAKWNVDKEIVVLFASLASGLIGAITMLIRSPQNENINNITETITKLITKSDLPEIPEDAIKEEIKLKEE